MPTTAREEAGNLILDFGDGSTYTIYPVPGSAGIEIQSLLVGVALGVTMNEQGPEAVIANTDRLTKLALGIPTEAKKRFRKAPNQKEQAAQRRHAEFDQMRAARQTIVAQAAILWNTGGGGIDAVNDLLNEAGGYPKALGRVMESSGLGDKYKVLKAYLDGVVQEPSSETGSTPSTTTPTGTANTSV